MQTEYSRKTDEELVMLAQSGDERAEENLIRKYKALIKAKAHLYFVAGADTDDIMQEGMMGLFKAIRSYQEGKQASFRTYAELCVNRQMVSAARQASRQKNMPLNNSISIYGDDGGGEHDGSIAETLSAGLEADPEAVLLMKESMEGIESEGKGFFSRLESKVLVEFLKGKAYHEIGEMMGKSPKSIDNALQRIRKKLESHLGPK